MFLPENQEIKFPNLQLGLKITYSVFMLFGFRIKKQKYTFFIKKQSLSQIIYKHGDKNISYKC